MNANKTAYNYYLKQVLGVSSYLGQPQKIAVPESKVSLKNEVCPETLVVVGELPVGPEKQLLDKIMSAVGHQQDYVIVTEGQYSQGLPIYSKYLFLKSHFFSKQKNYELFQIGDHSAVQGCALSDMLPPQPSLVIQTNKKQLWQSLKRLFHE